MNVVMCQQLYQHESDFRTFIDYCCSLLDTRLNLDLRSVFLSEPSAYPSTAIHLGRGDRSPSRSQAHPLAIRAPYDQLGEQSSSSAIPEQELLKQTIYAQPWLFIVEY